MFQNCASPRWMLDLVPQWPKNPVRKVHILWSVKWKDFFDLKRGREENHAIIRETFTDNSANAFTVLNHVDLLRYCTQTSANWDQIAKMWPTQQSTEDWEAREVGFVPEWCSRILWCESRTQWKHIEGSIEVTIVRRIETSQLEGCWQKSVIVVAFGRTIARLSPRCCVDSENEGCVKILFNS